VTALATIEAVVERGGDADDVLREVVSILHAELGRFVRISFVEEGGLEPGPAAGEEAPVTGVPIAWEGRRVAELEVGGEQSQGDRELLERVAALVSPYALVGWDTGGEAWLP
jgi:hypothetical protein